MRAMQTGARVGHYEIVAPIGRGGMGEVWKARDVKLGREVALKTLPPEFAADGDRVARLEREARLLAALNHPNIASIHAIEEHAGARFLVLELVDGQTLQDVLLGGALSVERSLKIALEVAAALEAAHEKGVIHRDLKPANLILTPDERVKVLDFGIAKNVASGGPETRTQLRTEIGVAMGTPAYMSPEQVRGTEVGKQTDLWSLGVLLYEMLTGQTPFAGDTAADTVGRVLEREPDYAQLPSQVPLRVRQLIRRCLEKDRKRRFHDAGDVRIEIEDALASPTEAPVGVKSTRAWWAAAGLATVIGSGMIGAVVAAHYATDALPPTARVSATFLGRPHTGLPFGTRRIAISQDGNRVAFAAQDQLWVRRLGDADPVAIEESSTAAVNPFFSPNGEWVGYFYNGLVKVPSAGGTPIVMTTTTARPAGAVWGTDGTIVFATTEGLHRVGENGGEPQLIARPSLDKGERLYAWPQFLPGERSVLFTVLPQNRSDLPQIALLDLQTLESRVLVTGGVGARYAPTGHLVYAAGETLNAVRFDVDTLETRGDVVALANTAIATTEDNGAADFAVSDTGTLVFLRPNPQAPEERRTLAWLDRQGEEEALAIEAGTYQYPRVSPDGTRVALDMERAGNRDIWILDLRRSDLTRLTTGPTEDIMPLWSGDGARVFFGSDRTGNFDVYSQAADGSSEARVEAAVGGFQTPQSRTPDGTRVIVYENFRDLSVLDLERSELTPLLHREFTRGLAEVSPDGNWIAYESDESGQQLEIYVRPFPDPSSRREKVSVNGGRFPKWGMTGSGELFYQTPDGALMAAAIELSPNLQVGTTTKLFDLQPPTAWISPRPYDVSPVDGRFLVTRSAPQVADQNTNVSVVLGWFSELLAQAPP